MQEYMALLPAWRREKLLKYKSELDRTLCAEAYLLLLSGLREYYGVTEAPHFFCEEHGKPHLEGYPDIHFNLSHCRKGVLCVLGDEPVGCDIESVRTKLNPSLCRYVCNDEEYAQVMQSTSPEWEFTKLWTRKEALVKLTGAGLSTSIPFLLSQEMLEKINLETHVNKEERFAYSIATWRTTI